MDLAAVAQGIASAYVGLPLVGRPSLLADSGKLQILLAELAAGVHVEPACSIAGISAAAVGNWIKRGNEEEAAGLDGPHVTFMRAVKACRAGVEARVTRNILAASEKPAFWAAGMTYLERTSPDRWARPSDRSDRTQSAIEVHVHGISTGDVLIGIAPQNATPTYQQPTILSNKVSEHLLHKQAVTYPQGNEGSESDGGVMHRGAPPQGGGPSQHAVQNTQNEENNFLLLEQLPSNPVVADSGTAEKKKFVNPAAERRRLALKNENSRLRRKKKLAKKAADALRHRASQEQKALKAKADEAALPDDVTG